jgi:dephospho-CoA kinase
MRRRSRLSANSGPGEGVRGNREVSPTSGKARTPSPVAVAITGGIGAGKSEALLAFARHGAATASSDEIVHRLLRDDEEVHAALRERWGDRVVGQGGADRRAIAEIVFAEPDELAWLEGLLHPRVVREYTAWRNELAAADEPPKILAVEIPLLYETGGERRFDAVVVVTAPPEVRAGRSAVAGDARERRLIPDEEKVARADFAYVNDGSLEELDEFVADVLAQLTP